MEPIENDIIKVGITHGDVNGIGYEVIIKTLMDARIMDFCTPIVYGSPKIAAYHRKALNVENFTFNNIKDAEEAIAQKPNIINCVDDNVRVELGKSTPLAGYSSFQALEAASEDLKNGKIDVLITAPINKYNIQSDQFAFAGHTEFLESQFKGAKSLMLMCYNNLRVGVVTGHVALKEVSQKITIDGILDKIRTLEQTLREDFMVVKPVIAVLGLNPHAGDGGLLGSEEQDIIIPAIDKARAEGIMALGPFPADGFFGHGEQVNFDAILAMYHDQGLIPFKTLAFEEGVNYTAGLPVVRTSPAHGTAYSIAGKNEASPDSFRAALYLACDIFRNRIAYKEATKNPLQKYDVENL
jgi:4-hydroxythreonine-4-phosphate dehydrogenase